MRFFRTVLVSFLALVYVIVHLMSLARFDPLGYTRILFEQTHYPLQLGLGLAIGIIYGIWAAKISFESIFEYASLWKLLLILPMIFVLDSTSNHNVAFAQILKTDTWIIRFLPFLSIFGVVSLIAFALNLLVITRRKHSLIKKR